MKPVISLFLSLCVSLAPLYGAAGVPGLDPVYMAPDLDMGAYIFQDKIYNTDQNRTAEKLQAGLSSFTEGIVKAFKEADMEKARAVLDEPSSRSAVFAKVIEIAKLAKWDIGEAEIESARALLNDPVFRDQHFANFERSITELDVEKVQSEFQKVLNDESFKEGAFSHNSEGLIAQLNLRIDEMTEKNHAPGGMAMLGAGGASGLAIAVFAMVVIGAVLGLALLEVDSSIHPVKFQAGDWATFYELNHVSKFGLASGIGLAILGMLGFKFGLPILGALGFTVGAFVFIISLAVNNIIFFCYMFSCVEDD